MVLLVLGSSGSFGSSGSLEQEELTKEEDKTEEECKELITNYWDNNSCEYVEALCAEKTACLVTEVIF